MKISKFNQFIKLNEKVGVATPSIIYSDLIYNKVENEFVEFKKSLDKSLSTTIEVKYREIKPYIKDRNQYSKFPVVGMTINVTFEKIPTDIFNKKYNSGGQKKKHAIGGWASNFGNKNWRNYSKKVSPIKMVTDHGIIIDLGIDITITEDYNIGSYKLKFDDDLGRVIWHELNHLYEDYNRLLSMKGLPIHKRKAFMAMAFADENSWNIKKEIFDVWHSDFLYYIYASEPYEVNAQVQEVGYFLQKYGPEKISNSQAYQNADYMQKFNADDFIIRLEDEIKEFYPEDLEEVKNRLKNMWISNYEKKVKEFRETPLINLNYLRRSSFDEFMRYFEIRLNEVGEKFKRKVLKTISQYEKIQ